MNDFPFISVSVLNFNGLGYLKETVLAVLNFDYPNYEVVIVDNNSTDESIKFIQGLNNPKIKLVKNDNKEYSKGKNLGVLSSKGEYVLLLDNDILIERASFLRDLLQKYMSLENPAFLGPVLLDKGAETSKYYGIYYSFYGINVFKKFLSIDTITSKMNSEKKLKIASFHGGAVFFRKEVWSKLGGYDEMQPFMLDDYDISARAYLFGYKNYLFNKYHIVHLGKDRDMNKKYFAWKFRYYFSGVLITFLKNFKTSSLLWRLPILMLFHIMLTGALIFQKKNIYIAGSFLQGYLFFLRNLRTVLKKRGHIQKSRINHTDDFLLIKPIL